MTGVLHVLRYRSASAPSLHAQRVAFADPPMRGRCFKVTPVRGGEPWSTARVDIEPQAVDERSVWFATRDTSYLLVIEPAPAARPPAEIEDEARGA